MQTTIPTMMPILVPRAERTPAERQASSYLFESLGLDGWVRNIDECDRVLRTAAEGGDWRRLAEPMIAHEQQRAAKRS